MNGMSTPSNTVVRRTIILAVTVATLAALLISGAAKPRIAFGAAYTVDTTSDANLTACTGDPADCSLRGAINNSNSNGGTDSIFFDIPGGSHTITPATALPAVTDSVVMDATTEPDFSGTPIVEISGATAGPLGANGLQIATGGSTVRGFVINGFGNFAKAGIFLSSSSGGNLIEGNYLGTDVTGTTSIGNQYGMLVQSPANTIGGSSASARNVISGNIQYGIRVEGSADGNFIKGNYIGTDATGTLSLTNNFAGIFINGPSNTTIGGTAGITPGGSCTGECNLISGNTGPGGGGGTMGIQIGGGSGNIVLGNYIGVDVTGAVDLGNSHTGIILSSAGGNTIGGALAGSRNVISGNTNFGVWISGATSVGNSVLGNHIGVSAAGTAAIANSGGGIVLNGGASGNTIGGTTAAGRNVISGNSGSGVTIDGSGTNGNTVKGNYIGTDVAGTGDVGNSGSGVRICGASSNEIGGTVAGAGNVISGNNNGIAIDGACGTTTGNLIRGNHIGVNAAGTGGLGNDNYGVLLGGDSGTVIGGPSAAARNVISGNINSGVLASASSSGAIIRGNYIGTNAAATGSIPNSQHGIDIQFGASSVTIGGVAAGEGNTIAYNAFVGVRVASGTGHDVRGNSIYSNGRLGIDLVGGVEDPFGVTANDAGDGDSGPNNLQNFPVITSASYDGTSTTISGTLDTALPATAKVDVYATDSADPSGYGEGRVYLGTDVPDTFGAWSLTIVGPPPYPRLTATATKSTSEFSLVYTMTGSPGAGLPSTAIAYKGQASPIGSTYNFFGPGQVPNTTGEVVFWSSLLSGTQGIFRWVSPGPATKYVATGDAAPGGGTFTDLTDAPVVNASGDVAFWAATSAPTEGIYHRTSGGVITKLVGVGDAAPGGSTFSTFDPPSGKGIAVINNLGDVAFWASLASGGQGVYLRKGDGTLLKVAATGDVTPAGGTFSTFLSGAGYTTIPIVTENQEVAFRGFMTGGPAQGLFLYSQGSGLTRIAATGDTSPTGGTYATFGRAPSPNDGGQVAFWANLSGSVLPSCPSAASPCGVFVWEDGASTKALASGDAATAQTGGQINDLGTAPFLNDAGQITVWAGISSGLAGQAIVRYTDGYLEDVAAIGNPSAIGGSFTDFIDPSGFPTNPLPNNQGRVVYWGDVSGGSGPEGVFITDAPTTTPEIVTGPVAGASAPGTNGGSFGAAFDLDINNGGSSVFANTVTGSATTNAGVFLFFAGSPGAPQSLTDVALQGQNAPGGGSFSTFGPPINNDTGGIVFKGTTSGGPSEGLYLFFAGSAEPGQMLAANGDPVTEGGGTFSAFSQPVINNINQIAANATVSGGSSGVFLFFAGQPVETADQLAAVGDPAPGGGGTYLFFAGNPSINDSGVVAARAGFSGGEEGLYLFFAGQPSSTAQKLAKTGDAVPDGGGATFTTFSDPIVNLDRKVVSKGEYSGGKGLYLFFAGQPTIKIADTTAGSAPGGGTFTDFGPAALTDGTDPIVVFRATTAGSEGLYLFFAGSVYSLSGIQQGSLITSTTDPDDTFGGASPVFPYLAMNNGIQVVFVANVQNGATTQGVFVANLDADSDTVRDYTDNCPNASNLTQINTDASLASTGATIVGDTLGDACDADWDNDSFSNTVELAIATNSKDNCPRTTGPGTGGDSWPLDINASSSANVSDILFYKGKTPHAVQEPTYPKRWDLDNNNSLNVSDILKFKGKTPSSCT